jgi:hypothetical protein
MVYPKIGEEDEYKGNNISYVNADYWRYKIGVINLEIIVHSILWL